MQALPRYPALYQVNTRVWLGELGRALGRPANLDDIPDAILDGWAERGFDWIWMLSVWTVGAASRQVSRKREDWLNDFRRTLPDLTQNDIGGSGFAIAAYDVAAALGGDAALARLRARLAERGLRLMLDFVPNHVALDHPWRDQHPDWLIRGSGTELAIAPANWVRIETAQGPAIFAHGRDPYFPGWPDTLQLNYADAGLQAAMAEELARIARRCDGVRCDMAMLVLPEVFQRTWQRDIAPFWPGAIATARAMNPAFRLAAEVYWDLEWELLEQGFDYAYDKRLYDRLRGGDTSGARAHLSAGLDYQARMVRFLENHDEARAAAAFNPRERHEAAALVTFFAPGLRFFQEGEFDGRRVHVSPHLVRRPDEPVDGPLAAFYVCLLTVLKDPLVRDGNWQALAPRAAWEGNGSWLDFIGHAWQDDRGKKLVVVVNFAPHAGQCYLPLTIEGISGRTVVLRDRLGGISYERDGSTLIAPGLYLDLPAWGVHAFAVEAG
ncbi:MAG: alpha-amylase [Rhodospirillales bacterium]|nr:alpha-amylase [Rhodospirillales bacterium]